MHLEGAGTLWRWYRRALLNPDERFRSFVQEYASRAGVFVNAVIRSEKKSWGGSTACTRWMRTGSNDQVLMLRVSTCVLHERFGLAA